MTRVAREHGRDGGFRGRRRLIAIVVAVASSPRLGSRLPLVDVLGLQGASDDLWVSNGSRSKQDATSDKKMKRKISQLQRCLKLDAAIRQKDEHQEERRRQKQRRQLLLCQHGGLQVRQRSWHAYRAASEQEGLELKPGSLASTRVEQAP